MAPDGRRWLKGKSWDRAQHVVFVFSEEARLIRLPSPCALWDVVRVGCNNRAQMHKAQAQGLCCDACMICVEGVWLIK